MTYPDIDPVAFEVGFLQVHWYGLMYLIGIALAWGAARLRIRWYELPWSTHALNELTFYTALGVILGGRVGYVLFYDFSQWLADPLRLIRFWSGGIAGMSFHGGVLGVVVALLLFSKRFKRPFWETIDFVAPLVPLGLAAGRLGNFINGELWGRPTSLPWGMVFPHVDPVPRHPSQLYEFFFEGIVLFLVLWFFAAKPRPKMAVSALFAILYGCFRFGIEFFREPDVQFGFVALGWMTMGQLLSLPLIAVGLGLFIWSYRQNCCGDLMRG